MCSICYKHNCFGVGGAVSGLIIPPQFTKHNVSGSTHRFKLDNLPMKSQWLSCRRSHSAYTSTISGKKWLPHIKGSLHLIHRLNLIIYCISIHNLLFPTTSQIPSANQTWLAGKSHLLMELFVAKNRWFSSHGTDYQRVTIVFITIHQNYHLVI